MTSRNRWNLSSDEEEERTKKPKLAKKKEAKKRPTAEAPSIAQAPAHNPLLQGSRSVYDTYEMLDRISEGTYGVVYRAKDTLTGEVVAVKQIKFDVDEEQTQDGFPVQALREINVLLALSHPSIVSVREVVVGSAPDQVFLAMECYEFDLKVGLARFDGPLFQSELKGIVHQILQGLDHMHDRRYLHRDLKTTNVLVHASGRIALADFGLARRYQEPAQEMTQLVVTLWYRPPELLFGERRYTPAIDMWSLGCILAELVRKDPLFQGQGELDQIYQIFEHLGVPMADNWPDFEQLPNAKLFRWRAVEHPLLTSRFPINPTISTTQTYLDSNGFDLLKGLLALDPSRRLTAKDALEHPFFTQGVAIKTPRFFSTSS